MRKIAVSSLIYPILVCGLTLLCAGVAMANEAASIKEAHERARQAIASHDYDTARLAYGDMLARFRDIDAEQYKLVSESIGATYMELGQLEEMAGRPQDAIADYKQAAETEEIHKQKSVTFYALQRLERLYFVRGSFGQAMVTANKELNDAIKYSLPSSARLAPMMMLAQCYAAQGLTLSARDEYDRIWKLADALDYIPPDTMQDLLVASSRVYRQLKQYNLAEDAERHAQSLNQKYQSMGRVYAPPTVVADSPSSAPIPAPTDQVGDRKPSFVDLNNCKPNYPREARLQEAQGTVIVILKVARDAQLTDIVLTQSSGNAALDEATIAAFRTCRYRPALQDGKPVDGDFKAIYKWVLE